MEFYKIEISEVAERDINNIYSYICNELKEPDIAKKLLAKIKQEIFSLNEMPSRHPLVFDEELKRIGIRKQNVENYVVFYILNDDTKIVYIVRVLYAKRDWINLL